MLPSDHIPDDVWPEEYEKLKGRLSVFGYAFTNNAAPRQTKQEERPLAYSS